MKITWGDWQQAKTVPIRHLSGSSKDNVQDYIDVYGSAGLISGGLITDAGSGNIAIADLTGAYRTADDHGEPLVTFNLASISNQAIPNNTIRYIGIERNSGTGLPQVVVKTADSWNTHTEFNLGAVNNEGGTLHIKCAPEIITNFGMHTLHRFYETLPLQRADRLGGIILGETGTRYVTVSAGELYERVTEFTISAIDTTPTGDTFDSYSSGGSESTGDTQWDNDNYDNAGTLTTLGANKYANLWFYIESDGGLVCVYGTDQYAIAAQAQAEAQPSVLPDRLVMHGRIIGRIIFQKGASTASIIESAFTTTFETVGVTDHGSLAGLADNDHPQYVLASEQEAWFFF